MLFSLEWVKYYKILELFRNSEDGHHLTLFKVAEIPFLNVKLKLDGMNQEEGGLAIQLFKNLQ